jgi:hypothetical protein
MKLKGEGDKTNKLMNWVFVTSGLVNTASSINARILFSFLLALAPISNNRIQSMKHPVAVKTLTFQAIPLETQSY